MSLSPSVHSLGVRKLRVLIVGGSVAGWTTAYSLAQLGFERITLLTQSQHQATNSTNNTHNTPTNTTHTSTATSTSSIVGTPYHSMSHFPCDYSILSSNGTRALDHLGLTTALLPHSSLLYSAIHRNKANQFLSRTDFVDILKTAPHTSSVFASTPFRMYMNSFGVPEKTPLISMVVQTNKIKQIMRDRLLTLPPVPLSPPPSPLPQTQQTIIQKNGRYYSSVTHNPNNNGIPHGMKLRPQPRFRLIANAQVQEIKLKDEREPKHSPWLVSYSNHAASVSTVPAGATLALSPVSAAAPLPLNELEADLIIGADGLNSFVRNNVLHQSNVLREVGGFYVTGHTGHANSSSSSRISHMWNNSELNMDRGMLYYTWGRGEKLATTRMNDPQEKAQDVGLWCLTINETDGAPLLSMLHDTHKIHQFVQNRVASFPQPCPSFLANTDISSIRVFPIQDMGISQSNFTAAHSEYAPRVVCVGEAAHGITWDLYQNMALNVEGATALALSLASIDNPTMSQAVKQHSKEPTSYGDEDELGTHLYKSVSRALDHYVSLICPRALYVANTSHSETTSTFHRSRFMASIRDMASSFVPAGATRENDGILLNYDILKDFPGIDFQKQW